MALFELFHWLRYFRERRLREDLSQKELLKRELRLLGLAVLVIGSFVAAFLLYIHFSKS